MNDPDEFMGSEENKLKTFKKTRNEISNRIELFVNLTAEKLDRLSLQKGTREIGSSKSI